MHPPFHKYHALGNDYLVLEPDAVPDLAPARIRLLCDRHFGIGSDGILLGPLPPPTAPPEALAAFALRIFNPDGSEAEKSGNGLRIFARYLADTGRVGADPFMVHTAGGWTRCQLLEGGRMIRVAMGRASFSSAAIPLTGPAREALEETLTIAGTAVRFAGVTVGNPHCVVLNQPATVDTAHRLGPLLETHPLFPHRTNVQFMEVRDRHTLRIEIWERGAGYTLASGSSASACAAAAVRLGRCDSPVTVQMPGGDLRVEVAADFAIVQTGPVTAVAQGRIAPELLA
ncbi:MAG: diaminopimelate epimerase [Lentisphaeria bacterium]